MCEGLKSLKSQVRETIEEKKGREGGGKDERKGGRRKRSKKERKRTEGREREREKLEMKDKRIVKGYVTTKIKRTL